MSDKLTTEKAEAAARSAGASGIMTVDFDASETIGVAIRTVDRNFAKRFETTDSAEDVFDWVSSVFERVAR